MQLTRSIKRSDKIDGFVVAVGRRWVLLAVLDDLIILNGFVAVRCDDVARVQRRGGPESFVGRALASGGQWPPAPTEVELDAPAGLLQTAAAKWPLLTLHFELDDPTVCYVGRPVGFTKRSVEWRDISPEADWSTDVAKRPLSQLTRVEFGGRYEEALAAVGGEAP